MKNTNRAIKEYSEAVKQAKSVYNQAVKHIEGNYIKGSSIYKDAMKTAKDTFENTVREMKSVFVKQVEKDFEETRTSIKNVVVTAPSEELLGLLPMIKNGMMTETEIQMFSDKFVGNYMDEKLLADAKGEQFKTIEWMMDDLNNLESKVNDFFDNYKGDDLAKISIHTATMMNGSPVELMNKTVDEFLTRYAGQK